MSRKPFLGKLHLNNFRSIQNETVVFDNPLILVGRNESGKTNFINSIGFLAECMSTPLRSVIDNQGGLGSLLYITTPADAPFMTLRSDFLLPTERRLMGHYAFSIAITPDGDYIVAHEQCILFGTEKGQIYFNRQGNEFSTNLAGVKFSPEPQSLALPLLSGTKEFYPVSETLKSMRVYAIDPTRIREAQGVDSSRVLERNGANVAGVLQSLSRNKDTRRRISELLSVVAPSITEVEPINLRNGRYGLLFTQGHGIDVPRVFDVSAMSDGTLYALGLIVAALQDPSLSLIAIEEPELYIHPGALGAVADLIEMVAQRSQVVITTHSPELLDTKWIKPDNIRVVEWNQGKTHISPLGAAPVKVLQRHLMSAGELLRSNALDAAPYEEEQPEEIFEKVAA